MEEHDRRGAAWNALPDCPADVERLIRELLDEQTKALAGALEAVYLHGSLVFGDFQPEVSDIDLVVVVAADVDDEQLARLQTMHDAFALGHPDWIDRIEAVYVSSGALRSFRVRESPLVVISPGEPLHRTQTSPGWVMNWHVVREHSVTLLGPPPGSIITPTTHEDFEAAIRTYLPELVARVESSRVPGTRPYCVLTVCRGLSTCQQGRHVSKTGAARWAADRYPEWSDVIARALESRKGGESRRSSDVERERAIAFVRFGVSQLGETTGRSPAGRR
jgi:predicted nucleotidyltransferase